VTKTHPHVAVVDDEEPIRKALMRLMRSVGLSVETFASGPEFLQSLDTRLPDCVLLDLHMPQMNGFHVQAHLAGKYAALPVIIVTGHDLPNARERAMAGGLFPFGFLWNPLEFICRWDFLLVERTRSRQKLRREECCRALIAET
jgi:two-component system, LuxR family, response regulator FixJ